MKLSELRSLIHELIRGEVEETSTSGNAGAYNRTMKQLLTEHIPFQVDKLLVEQSIKANKPLRVSGIIQRAGVENHNGRIYEQDILEREIQKYKDGPVKEKRALGELDHPDSAVINLNNVSHNIVEITMRGGDVHGVIEILTTPAGNILKELTYYALIWFLLHQPLVPMCLL